MFTRVPDNVSCTTDCHCDGGVAVPSEGVVKGRLKHSQVLSDLSSFLSYLDARNREDTMALILVFSFL